VNEGTGTETINSAARIQNNLSTATANVSADG